MKNLTEINYPNNSKIWIFSSNKPLNSNQTEIVSSILNKFFKNWTSHGKKLKSDFMVLYNYFIIVLVDENLFKASGCSIDLLVKEIIKIEEKLNIELMDKLNVKFFQNKQIISVDVNTFKELIKKNIINHETLVFNNTINNFGEFKSKWKIPAKDSWLNRYF